MLGEIDVLLVNPALEACRVFRNRMVGGGLEARNVYMSQGNIASNLALVRGIRLPIRVSSKIRMVSSDPASF